MKTVLHDDVVRSIVDTTHHDPFLVLGAHVVEAGGRKCVAIRAFLPNATCAQVIEVSNNVRYPMQRIHPAGFFEVMVESRPEVFAYRLGVEFASGATTEFYDSYAFMPTLGEMDLYLFGEGNHHEIYKKLGAHLRVMPVGGVQVGGIGFAVWAPNAKRVSVVGDFNNWDGRCHVMRTLGSSGVWEIFVPGLPFGQNYKYEIRLQNNQIIEKSDPFAFYAEVRPKTASKTYDLEGYSWGDRDYLENRRQRQWRREAVSIYEVHLGSWMRVPEEGNRFLTYRELAQRLCDYVKKAGFTHIELMPVSEHPLDISWGYQVTGYFAPTSRFGCPKDFMYFVDYMHQNGIGVILDWVPAHFPKDWHGLARFDGSALFEHEDPRLGEHKDWATLIFNFGRSEVKNFLISNALFWLEYYHLDGFRVDAVASMLYLDYSRKAGEWIPNRYGGRENLEAIEFMKYMNSVVYQKFPGVMTIAEESTAWPGVSKPCDQGGLGFGFKWNMGWMHDTLEYLQKDAIYRKYHHHQLTFPLIYAFHENFMSVLSHDEVVHGKGSVINKMPGDFWQKFANTRLLYGFMWTMPGKKVLFMGQDFGQWHEWNCNQSLDWHLLGFEPHHKLFTFMGRLNELYRAEPSLHQLDCEPGGFEWITFQDAESGVVSWIRRGQNPNDFIVFIANMTPVPRLGYRVGVPRGGYYEEILNSDSDAYGGSNIGNFGGFQSENVGWQNHPHSLNLNLPPLGIVGMKVR